MDRLAISQTPQLPSARKAAERSGNAGAANSAAGSESEKESPEALHTTKVAELQVLADRAFADDNVRLSISFEKSIGRFIYRGLDPETGEVVREYPPEEVVQRIAAIRKVVGVAYDNLS